MTPSPLQPVPNGRPSGQPRTSPPAAKRSSLPITDLSPPVRNHAKRANMGGENPAKRVAIATTTTGIPYVEKGSSITNTDRQNGAKDWSKRRHSDRLGRGSAVVSSNGRRPSLSSDKRRQKSRTNVISHFSAESLGNPVGLSPFRIPRRKEEHANQVENVLAIQFISLLSLQLSVIDFLCFFNQKDLRYFKSGLQRTDLFLIKIANLSF